MEREDINSTEPVQGDTLANPIEINEEGAILVPSAFSDDVEPEETTDQPLIPDLVGTEKLTIGYVVESPFIPLTKKPIALETSIPDDLEDPESAALDVNERVPKNDGDETDFHDLSLGLQIFENILILLQADSKLSVEELFELWTVFLRPEQRQYVIRHLKKINIHEPSETIVARLRGSSLAAVITAWLQFKSLLDSVPPQLRDFPGRQPHSTGRNAAWAILMHCMLLEDLRRRALPAALEAGMTNIPDRLRFPTQGYDLSAAHATFDQILNALAERAACRKVHPEWLQLTNAMVLHEVGKYLKDLKEVVLVLYPGAQGSQEWVEIFGTG